MQETKVAKLDPRTSPDEKLDVEICLNDLKKSFLQIGQ